MALVVPSSLGLTQKSPGRPTTCSVLRMVWDWGLFSLLVVGAQTLMGTLLLYTHHLYGVSVCRG